MLPLLRRHALLGGVQDLRQLGADLDRREDGRDLALVERRQDDRDLERIRRARVVRHRRGVAVVTARRRHRPAPGQVARRNRRERRQGPGLRQRQRREHQRLDVDRPRERPPVHPARAQLGGPHRVADAEQLDHRGLPRSLDRVDGARRVHVDDHHARPVGEHARRERRERHLVHSEAALAQRGGDRDAVRRRHAHQDGVGTPPSLHLGNVELRHRERRALRRARPIFRRLSGACQRGP